MVCRIAKINILIPIKLMEGFILKKFLFTILALLMTAFIIGCSGDEDVMYLKKLPLRNHKIRMEMELQLNLHMPLLQEVDEIKERINLKK